MSRVFMLSFHEWLDCDFHVVHANIYIIVGEFLMNFLDVAFLPFRVSFTAHF